MALTTTTHIVSIDEKHCRRCGCEIPPSGNKPWVSGQHVGLINATATGVVVPYPIGDRDTNELCKASQPVAAVEAALTDSYGHAEPNKRHQQTQTT